MVSQVALLSLSLILRASAGVRSRTAHQVQPVAYPVRSKIRARGRRKPRGLRFYSGRRVMGLRLWRQSKGEKMRVERRYTKDGQSPYADIAFRLTTSEIKNPDGSVVFKAENVEIPEFWSQVASDVLAQKYFRKAGVPSRLKK